MEHLEDCPAYKAPTALCCCDVAAAAYERARRDACADVMALKEHVFKSASYFQRSEVLDAALGDVEL